MAALTHSRLIEWWKRLREHRENSGLTQEQVAAAMGIHARSISRIENGSLAIKLPMLLAMLDLYEVPFEAAFIGDDEWDRAYAQVLRACQMLPAGALSAVAVVAELLATDHAGAGE